MQLLRQSVLGDTRLHAPPLFQTEVANVVRQRRRRGDISLGRAEILLGRLLALPVTIAAPAGLLKRAFQLAEQFDLPAIYDAHYLALAEFAWCDLWTDDQRLLRHVGGRFLALRWVGDVQP